MANDYPVDPQLFGVWYPDKDYSYTNRWTPDQDQDHIPDLWELRYYTWITNCIPGQDSDGDEHDNWNEYVADTGPRNAASYFHQYITAVSGHISAVRMDAPTTNSRLYEIYWKTNLVDTSVWTPCGLETWGSAAGTGLWFDITDKPTGSMPRIFYRLGVRMP
jgi:arylsulfatase A-like enzyme